MLVLTTTRLYQDEPASRPAPAGALTLTDEFDQVIEFDQVRRRCLRVAHLRRPSIGDDILPPIRDATVVRMAGNRMTLSGFESDGKHRAAAQSWYVELPGAICRIALLYEDGGAPWPGIARSRCSRTTRANCSCRRHTIPSCAAMYGGRICARPASMSCRGFATLS